MTRWLLIVLAGVAIHPALAQGPIAPGKVVEGTLSFDAKATAGPFIGTTSKVTGEMTGGAQLPEVHGYVEAPVRSLETGNERRDRDLNKSMESAKYPVIRFELTGVTPAKTAGDSVPATLLGNMLIHGVTRAVELPGSVVLRAGRARVRTDFPLNLKDYKIGGLTKMLGMLKMYEDIVVHVDVAFSSVRSGPGPASR